jgi:cytoskeletal protein CcmA (bactofilin family)
MPDADGEFPTVLGPDAVFKGELQFEKGVKVLGCFEGSIQTKGRLLVAQGAKMKADVHAGDIEVEGDIQGNLTTTNKVKLKASAKLHGDLRTARLEVNEGAVFVGNCVVGPIDVGEAGKRPPVPAPSQEQKPKQAPEPALAGSKK